MQYRDSEVHGKRSGRHRWLRVQASLNTVGLFLLLVVVALLCLRLRVSETRNGELRQRLVAAESGIQSWERETTARLGTLELDQARRLDEARQELRLAEEAAVARSLAASRDLLERISSLSQARQGEVVASLRQAIAAVDERVVRRLAEEESDAEAFRAIQERFDSSIYMIHCEFDYLTNGLDGQKRRHKGSGWGTGFIVSDDGHLVTNKHVIQPWKFDSELAAMEALGEITVDAGSVRLSAWPAGCPCLDDQREPAIDSGYNSWHLDNLELILTAPDKMDVRTMDIAGAEVEYKIHELDDNDLALLRLEGATGDPLPFASPEDLDRLDKLDPVMALGYPRGHGGIERMRAITSPSLGTVRKIENTIQVTASIIPGNSGGPLFSREGKVVGVVTRIYSETLGICLKIDLVRELLAQAHALEAKSGVTMAPALSPATLIQPEAK